MTENLAREEAERFTPFRVRCLPVSGQVIFLFCILINVSVGWHFYTPLLDNGWGDWDDHTWRRDAEHRNTLSTIFDPFLNTRHEAMDTSYVPIQSLIYHYSINVLDQGPMPIRAIGFLVHILNGVLILLLAFRFTGSIPAAQLASLFFLLYPRNASTQGWLCASLAHGLVLALYLTAFLLMQTYFHRRGIWRLFLALFLFIIAVLTKELSTTLFGALVLYAVLVARGIKSLWPINLRTYLGYFGRHLPFLAVVVAAVAIQSMKYDSGYVASKFGGMTFGARNPIRLLELATLFVHWGRAWTKEEMLWGIGAMYAALMTGIWLSRKNPPLLFLILWIPMVLTPFTISNFRDVHALGRYLYEASAVVAVLLSVLGIMVVRWRPVVAWPTLVGSFLTVAAFAAWVSKHTH